MDIATAGTTRTMKNSKIEKRTKNQFTTLRINTLETEKQVKQTRTTVPVTAFLTLLQKISSKEKSNRNSEAKISLRKTTNCLE